MRYTGYQPLVSWLLPSANAHVTNHAMLCSRRNSPLLRVAEIPPPVALPAQRAHGPHRGDATDAVGQGKDGTGVACTKQQLLTINSPVILRGTLTTIPPRTWLNCHFILGKNLVVIYSEIYAYSFMYHVISIKFKLSLLCVYFLLLM